MSEKGKSRSSAMTLEEALQQLSLLEEHIQRLQAALRDTEQRMADLSALEDAILNLKGGVDDALIPLDPRWTVVVPGSIKPSERVVVHAGLNIFVEVSHEKALAIIRDERATVAKVAEAYRRELAKILNYYSALRSAVEQALATAQR